MRTVFLLAAKDLQLMLRDRVGFFFVFFFPLIFAVFFGIIFSGEGGGMSAIPVAVTDEDNTPASRRFVEELDKANEISLTITGRDEAISLVRRGKRVAYIILPDGFERSLDRIFQGGSIDLEVGVDPARKAKSGMLRGILIKHGFSIIQDLFMDPGAMKKQVERALRSMDEHQPEFGSEKSSPALRRFFGDLDRFLTGLENFSAEDTAGGDTRESNYGWQPISLSFSDVSVERIGPKNAFDITFPQAIIWVLIGCSATFGVSLVIERRSGTLVRLRSAPLSPAGILAGKALACFFTILAASLLLFAVFSIFFHLRPGSLSLLAGSIITSAFAFVGIMMLIAVLGKTEASASGIGWAFLLVMAMIGGGMVPLITLPSWMQVVSNVSIVKWVVLAVEGAIWRGFTITEMAFPWGVLISVGSICFVLGVRLFQWSAE